MTRIVLLFLTGFLFSLVAQARNTSLRMIYHKDKIIVQVTTRLNDTLHFLFDTGSYDILLDSVIADKYGLIPKKEYNNVVPFTKGVYLRGIIFQNNNLFVEPELNHIFTWGTAVNIQSVKIPSDIKIDGIIGPNKAMEQFIVLLDFTKGIFSFNDSNLIYNLPINGRSVGMMYSDEGYPSGISKNGRSILSNKIKLYYNTGHCIDTHLIFDTGCHWESAIITKKHIDTVFTKEGSNGKVEKPFKYFDKREKVFYWITDSMVIANNIIRKKVKTYYVQAFSLRSLGSLDTYIFIGAPFFKRFKQVYFNFPAKRIDFIN